MSELVVNSSLAILDYEKLDQINGGDFLSNMATVAAVALSVAAVTALGAAVAYAAGN